MKASFRLSILLFFLPALLVACGGGGDDSGGSGSSGATATATPVAIDLTKDDLNRSVTPPASATRVVAMSPSIVELLFAVGVTPVGRPSSADYPEAAKNVQAFGTAYQPNFEQIAAMKPDLIIADSIIDAGQTMEALSRLGAPVFAMRVSSFDDVTKGLRRTGALTGQKAAGETQAKALEDKLAAVKAKLPTTGPSTLVLVSAGPGQFIAEKSDSYLGDILSKLGAKNVVSNSEQENFRFPGFTDYSTEVILQKNPDVLLTISAGPPPTTQDQVKSNGALSSLTAVKNGRIYEVNATIYLQSAGPRVSQILDELPRLLYPNVFATAR